MPATTLKKEDFLRFEESSVITDTLQEHLEQYTQDEHPGLLMLDGLYAHYFGLSYFHSHIQELPVTPEKILCTAELLHALYDRSSDGALHNPLLTIEGEPDMPLFHSRESYEIYTAGMQSERPTHLEALYDKAIEIDLRRNAPEVTSEVLRTLRSTIKELEISRAEFLAVTAALARLDFKYPGKGDRQVDLMRRLLRIRSHFSETFHKLTGSEALSNLMFTIEETKHMIENRADKGGQPLSMGTVPRRVRSRYWDYKSKKGRRGSQLAYRQHVSIDKVAEKLDSEESIGYPEGVTVAPESHDRSDLYAEIRKLPPAKREVLEKYLQQNPLTPRERKVVSRFTEDLRRKFGK